MSLELSGLLTEFITLKKQKLQEKGIFYLDCYNACLRRYEDKPSVPLRPPPSKKKD